MQIFYTRGIAATLISISLAAMPVIALAQSTDAQSQIQTLMSQITALQNQLKTLLQQNSNSDHGNSGGRMGSTTPSMPIGRLCVMLERDLDIGSHGDDVRSVQSALAENGDLDEDNVTGFFGPLTMQAMKRFQEKFGIASSTTGFVGPKTRGFLRGRCGGGDGMSGGMGTTTNRGQGSENEHFMLNFPSTIGGMMGTSSNREHGGMEPFGTSTMHGDDGNKGPGKMDFGWPPRPRDIMERSN